MDPFLNSLFLITPRVIRKWQLEKFIVKPPVEGQINSCVILGSFRFHDEIMRVRNYFEQNGIFVSAPDKGKLVSGQEGFAIADSDNVLRQEIEKYGKLNQTEFETVLEWRFLKAIEHVGFVYIVDNLNKDGLGYAGTTVAGELGRAMFVGKPIYSMNPLDKDLDKKEGWSVEPIWYAVASQIKDYDPETMVRMVKSGKLDEEDYEWCPGYDEEADVWEKEKFRFK